MMRGASQTEESPMAIFEKSTEELVEHMIEMEEFLGSTMTRNEDFEDFLAINPKHDKRVKRISELLKKLLQSDDADSSLMDDYIIAFNHMKASHGYSMVEFLDSNPPVEEYLQKVIGKIDEIYYAYLVYQKGKLTEALAKLEASIATEKRPKRITCTFIAPLKLRFKNSKMQESIEVPFKALSSTKDDGTANCR
ncbi:MAG: hypothetical protein JSR17_03610 [Proteobacteria bacterium]|nr:hypothetical protein [Pseudomonadota bacterium]